MKINNFTAKYLEGEERDQEKEEHWLNGFGVFGRLVCQSTGEEGVRARDKCTVSKTVVKG